MTPTDTFSEPRFGIVVEHPTYAGLRYLVLGPGEGGNGNAYAIVVSDNGRLGRLANTRSAGQRVTISWFQNDHWTILDPGIEQ